MSSLEKIANELKELGYNPSYIEETPQGRTVFIRYHVLTGKYKGGCPIFR